MTQATARTAVYNAVNGVTDVGQVYDYQRWAAEWGDFLSLFKTTISGTPQIRGWVVQYRGFSVETVGDEGLTIRTFGDARQRTHRFQVKGYMGVDDSAATEKTFSALAEAVANALDTDSTLHGSSFLDAGDAELTDVVNVPLGGTLCHYAEINFTVSEMYDA